MMRWTGPPQRASLAATPVLLLLLVTVLGVLPSCNSVLAQSDDITAMTFADVSFPPLRQEGAAAAVAGGGCQTRLLADMCTNSIVVDVRYPRPVDATITAEATVIVNQQSQVVQFRVTGVMPIANGHIVVGDIAQEVSLSKSMAPLVEEYSTASLWRATECGGNDVPAPSTGVTRTLIGDSSNCVYQFDVAYSLEAATGSHPVCHPIPPLDPQTLVVTIRCTLTLTTLRSLDISGTRGDAALTSSRIFSRKTTVTPTGGAVAALNAAMTRCAVLPAPLEMMECRIAGTWEIDASSVAATGFSTDWLELTRCASAVVGRAQDDTDETVLRCPISGSYAVNPQAGQTSVTASLQLTVPLLPDAARSEPFTMLAEHTLVPMSRGIQGLRGGVLVDPRHTAMSVEGVGAAAFVDIDTELLLRVTMSNNATNGEQRMLVRRISGTLFNADGDSIELSRGMGATLIGGATVAVIAFTPRLIQSDVFLNSQPIRLRMTLEFFSGDFGWIELGGLIMRSAAAEIGIIPEPPITCCAETGPVFQMPVAGSVSGFVTEAAPTDAPASMATSVLAFLIVLIGAALAGVAIAVAYHHRKKAKAAAKKLAEERAERDRLDRRESILAGLEANARRQQQGADPRAGSPDDATVAVQMGYNPHTLTGDDPETLDGESVSVSKRPSAEPDSAPDTPQRGYVDNHSLATPAAGTGENPRRFVASRSGGPHDHDDLPMSRQRTFSSDSSSSGTYSDDLSTSSTGTDTMSSSSSSSGDTFASATGADDEYNDEELAARATARFERAAASLPPARSFASSDSTTPGITAVTPPRSHLDGHRRRRSRAPSMRLE